MAEGKGDRAIELESPCFSSMGPASFSFSSNSAQPAAGPGDGWWSSPTMPLITTPAFTGRGAKSTPTVLLWTSFPGAVTGKVTLKTPGGTAAGPGNFTVQ